MEISKISYIFIYNYVISQNGCHLQQGSAYILERKPPQIERIFAGSAIFQAAFTLFFIYRPESALVLQARDIIKGQIP